MTETVAIRTQAEKLDRYLQRGKYALTREQARNRRPCQACDGSGYSNEPNKCGACKGFGYIPALEG